MTTTTTTDQDHADNAMRCQTNATQRHAATPHYYYYYYDATPATPTPHQHQLTTHHNTSHQQRHHQHHEPRHQRHADQNPNHPTPHPAGPASRPVGCHRNVSGATVYHRTQFDLCAPGVRTRKAGSVFAVVYGGHDPAFGVHGSRARCGGGTPCRDSMRQDADAPPDRASIIGQCLAVSDWSRSWMVGAAPGFRSRWLAAQPDGLVRDTETLPPSPRALSDPDRPNST